MYCLAVLVNFYLIDSVELDELDQAGCLCVASHQGRDVLAVSHAIGQIMG